jgi:hypothetical protein
VIFGGDFQKLAAQTGRSTGAQHTAGRSPVVAGERLSGWRLLPSAGVTPPAVAAQAPPRPPPVRWFIYSPHMWAPQWQGRPVRAGGQGRRGDPMHSKGPVASTVVTVTDPPTPLSVPAGSTRPRSCNRRRWPTGAAPGSSRHRPDSARYHPPAASKLIGVAVLARARRRRRARADTPTPTLAESRASRVGTGVATDWIGYCVEERKSHRHVRQRLQSLSGYNAGYLGDANLSDMLAAASKHVRRIKNSDV